VFLLKTVYCITKYSASITMSLGSSLILFNFCWISILLAAAAQKFV